MSDDEKSPDETSNTVELTEPTDVDEADGTDETVEATAPRRARRGVGRYVGVILVVAALVISAGVAGWLYFYQYRVDQQTNADAANVALEAAKTGTVALLSYSPDTLDKDFAAAKSKLTGDFLSYYTQFTEQIVTPAAKEKQVKTVAAVIRAAVSEIQPDSATVLLSSTRPPPARRTRTARSRPVASRSV